MTRPRRKRLLGISLRMLFVVLTVLCVWLGLKVRKAENQKEAVAWVEKMGGEVWYDYELDDDLKAIGHYEANGKVVSGWQVLFKDGKFVSDAESPAPQWLVDLVGVDYFATVAAVVVQDHGITDATPLATLTDLKVLNICGTRISDLSPLDDLKQLRFLSVTDLDSILTITKLPELERVYALFASDRELAELAKHLPDCKVSWRFHSSD